IPSRVPQGEALERRVVPLLAERQVRSETDHSHQPPDDRPGTDACRGRLENAVRESLLLDGNRATGTNPGSGTRPGILVRNGKSKPFGRPQRFRWFAHQGQGPGRGRKRDADGADHHESADGTEIVIPALPLRAAAVGALAGLLIQPLTAQDARRTRVRGYV